MQYPTIEFSWAFLFIFVTEIIQCWYNYIVYIISYFFIFVSSQIHLSVHFPIWEGRVRVEKTDLLIPMVPFVLINLPQCVLWISLTKKIFCIKSSVGLKEFDNSGWGCLSTVGLVLKNERGVAIAGWGLIFVWGVGTPLPTMNAPPCPPVGAWLY